MRIENGQMQKDNRELPNHDQIRVHEDLQRKWGKHYRHSAKAEYDYLHDVEEQGTI